MGEIAQKGPMALGIRKSECGMRKGEVLDFGFGISDCGFLVSLLRPPGYAGQAGVNYNQVSGVPPQADQVSDDSELRDSGI
jgi:hypothetical protein